MSYHSLIVSQSSFKFLQSGNMPIGPIGPCQLILLPPLLFYSVSARYITILPTRSAPSTQGILKGNTWAKQIITTTTTINNDTVLTNVGIPSTLLNKQPVVGDRFYSMIDYTDTNNKHKYIFALLEVTAIGSSNTQPFSVKVIGKQDIHYSHALGYRKHVQMNAIAGGIAFSYFSTTSGFPSGNPTELVRQIRSMSMGELEATGVWLIGGKKCVINRVKVSATTNELTLYGYNVTDAAGATLDVVTTNVSITNFLGWTEPISYFMNA
nr:MAG TPA: hypothetical protein [Caudoviricetes sp.]